VLYVSNSFSFSPNHASAVTTYEIVRGLAENGHKITMLVPSLEGDAPTEHTATERAVLENVDVVTALSVPADEAQESLLHLGLSCSVLFVPLILKAVKRANYDVVISMYHPTHLATFAGLLIARVLKLPLLVKVHDLVSEADDPNFFRRTYKEAVFRLYSTFLRKGDIFLVPSVEWMSLLAKLYGVDEKRIILFPNGVNAAKFKPNADCKSLESELGLEDKKVVLYMGRISRIRALDCLVKALPSVVREEPEVRLVLIGEGEEKKRLADLSKNLGVDKFVLFLNEVDHDAIVRYICLADVAVGPLIALPVTVGTQPIKVLEYMACGKPVVSCYGGASKSLVIDGYNGLLIGSGNVEELGSAILRLLKDDGLAEKLGLNARRHIECYHDWNVITDRLDKMLSKIVRNRMQN